MSKKHISTSSTQTKKSIELLQHWTICAIRSKDQESLEIIEGIRSRLYSNEPKLFYKPAELFQEIKLLVSDDSNISIIKYMIDILQIKIANCKDESGYSLIHRSCMFGATKITLHLLKQGYDINNFSNEGETPITLAAILNRKELLKNLANDTAAKSKIVINKQNKIGNSALHYAASNNSVECINILIESFNANKFLKNSNNMTYLHILGHAQRLEIKPQEVPQKPYPYLLSTYEAIAIYSKAKFIQENGNPKDLGKAVEYFKKSINILQNTMNLRDLGHEEQTIISNHLECCVTHLLRAITELKNPKAAIDLSNYLLLRATKIINNIGVEKTQEEDVFKAKIYISLAVALRNSGNDSLACEKALLSIKSLKPHMKYNPNKEIVEALDEAYYILGMIFIRSDQKQAIEYLEQITPEYINFDKVNERIVYCAIYCSIYFDSKDYQDLFEIKLKLIKIPKLNHLYTIFYNMSLHTENTRSYLDELNSIEFDKNTEHEEYTMLADIKKQAYIYLEQYDLAAKHDLNRFYTGDYSDKHEQIYLMISLLSIYRLNEEWETGLKFLNQHKEIYEGLDNIDLNILRWIFLIKNNKDDESDLLLNYMLVEANKTGFINDKLINMILFKVYSALDVKNAAMAQEYYDKLPAEVKRSSTIPFFINLAKIHQQEQQIELEEKLKLESLEQEQEQEQERQEPSFIETDIAQQNIVEQFVHTQKDEDCNTNIFLEFAEDEAEMQEYFNQLNPAAIHRYFSHQKKILLTKNKKNNSYITTKEIAPESFGYKSDDISLTPIYTSEGRTNGASKFFGAISPKLKRSLDQKQLELFETALKKGKVSKLDHSIGVKFIYQKGVELKINGDARLYTNQIIQNKEGDSLILFEYLINKHNSNMNKKIQGSSLVIKQFNHEYTLDDPHLEEELDDITDREEQCDKSLIGEEFFVN